MAQRFTQLEPDHLRFIARQPVFFVATAPLSPEGHVNVSPKGYDTFRVLSPAHVAYADLTGSGNETSAHLAENGRITLLFLAFDGAPLILRIYGRGHTVLPGMPEWEPLARRFTPLPGLRQFVSVAVTDVKTSCGMGVPEMSLVRERSALLRWAERLGPAGLARYWREHNRTSMDGLDAPLAALLDGGAPPSAP